MKKMILLASAGVFGMAVAASGQVTKSATTSVNIESGGPGTTADYYGSGADDGFEEYGIATFTTFSAADFGGSLTDITSVTYDLTVNDRGFSDGSDFRLVLSTDQFGGDYSALSFNAAVDDANGLDPSQYTNAVHDLGVYDIPGSVDMSADGGEVISYTLNLTPAAETDLISAINAGNEFSLSIHATNVADDITFSGVGNTFDPGDPQLTIVPEPSTYAAVLGLLGLAIVALRRRRR